LDGEPYDFPMRISVEVDAKRLQVIQRITGQKRKSTAINRALDDYLRLRQRLAFIEKALTGQTDYALSNDDLETFDEF
jgi:Arc/MetJ family transcription regulator